MNKLVVSLNIVLANSFLMYFKAHSFHWNVVGKRFHMIHNFFGEIYEEIFESIDSIAENIRMLDQFAPISLAELIKYSTIDEETQIVDCQQMVSSLLEANDEVLDSLNSCFELAEKQNKQGLMDLLASRIAVHLKYRWMLKSTQEEE